MDSTGRKTRTVSTKLTALELERLDELALRRGVTRSFLLKELVKAALDGRVLLALPPPIAGSIRDFGRSDAGRAALRRARNDAEAALNGKKTARKADLATREAGAAG